MKIIKWFAIVVGALSFVCVCLASLAFYGVVAFGDAMGDAWQEQRVERFIQMDKEDLIRDRNSGKTHDKHLRPSKRRVVCRR